MALIAGVEVDLRRPDVVTGVAFRLSDSAVEPATFSTDPGQLVEIHPSAKLAVVFLNDSTRAVETAHEAAQRSLDILAFTGRGAVTLPRAHDECAMWWFDGEDVVLRVVVTKEVRVRVGPVRAEVRNAAGQLVESSAPPEPLWTPALRFFRQSQVAEDVFDAYRNTFLSLEAILSAIVAGGPGGERVWLEYALREVDARGIVDLASYVSSPGHDPVAAFLEEQYVAIRLTTFHAKEHRAVLLPGSLAERDQVAEAHERLTKLVVALAPEIVQASYPSGAMTVGGFEQLYIGPKVGHLTMVVERHEHDDVVERIPLESGYLGRLDDRGFEHGFLGEVAASAVVGRVFDAVTATAPAAGGLTSALDQTFPMIPIDAAGADRFGVGLGFVLHNARLPKRRFTH